MPLKSKIGGMVLAAVMMMGVNGCAFAPSEYHPLASLEDVETKEELNKKRNWQWQIIMGGASSTTSVASGAISGVFIQNPFLAPLGSLGANVLIQSAAQKNYGPKDITEISDLAIVKVYEIDNREQYAGAVSGGMDTLRNDFIVSIDGYGRHGSEKLKPAVLYIQHKGCYSEGVIIKKDVDGNYQYWKIPLFIKKDGNLVYFLDEKLKIKNIKTNRRKFEFSDDKSEEVVKNFKEVSLEVLDWFLKNKHIISPGSEKIQSQVKNAPAN